MLLGGEERADGWSCLRTVLEAIAPLQTDLRLQSLMGKVSEGEAQGGLGALEVRCTR